MVTKASKLKRVKRNFFPFMWVVAWVACVMISGLLTKFVLAPQLTNLFDDLGMHGASEIGLGLAFLILVASMASKVAHSADKSILVAVTIITVCVALVRVKVVNEKMGRAQAEYVAAMQVYNEAKANKEAAIAEAKADPDLHAKAPYLSRKREARAQLKLARKMPLPEVPVAPNTNWDAWMVSVLGPAGLEAVTAILIKFLGGKCGQLLMFALIPFGIRQKEEAEAEASSEKPNPLMGVQEQLLDKEARQGLNLGAQTWRGLPLGEPKLRKGVLWPTLANSTKTVFIGSVPARRAAGEVIKRNRRDASEVNVISLRR